MSKLKAILIGAGNRGTAYTNIMHQGIGDFEVVAVAEPIEEKRNFIAEKHGISEDMCFTSWEPMLEKEKFADVALVCTLDRDHFAPAMAA
ncbi:MAG: Gfo/Idh/MocA family oxidoreductase, partial [Clostridia bacterium]|nr:Gfo/Idh/MocA family oxidoreductase [Clostridia bacterium]